MSMILDAIKRSKESETITDGVPSVDTEHYIPSESNSRLPWIIAAVSVGLLLTVLLWQAFAPDETEKLLRVINNPRLTRAGTKPQQRHQALPRLPSQLVNRGAPRQVSLRLFQLLHRQ